MSHTFCKVVQQHTEGVVGSIVWILLEIYLSFQQRTNFENPLRIDKVIVTSLVYYFFGTQCIKTPNAGVQLLGEIIYTTFCAVLLVSCTFEVLCTVV